MDEIYKKRFIRFLKECNAYREFINEFKDPKGVCNRRVWAETEIQWDSEEFESVPNETFESYCMELNNPANLINFAFSWGDTNKKHNYWETLSIAWRRELRELRKINNN